MRSVVHRDKPCPETTDLHHVILDFITYTLAVLGFQSGTDLPQHQDEQEQDEQANDQTEHDDEDAHIQVWLLVVMGLYQHL